MRLITMFAISIFSLNAFAGNTKEMPQIELVEAVLNLDLDQDGKLDLAFLTQDDKNSDDLTLWIKLYSEANYYKFPSIAYNNNHGAYGVGTYLQANALGSLQVYSYNEAIGRSRWDSTLTIAYRKNALVLAGFTYNERDTLDLSSSTCDVNLLSKKGVYQSTLNDVSGEAQFDVSPKDVLRMGQFNYDSVIDTYLNNYCYTFDIHETE